MNIEELIAGLKEKGMSDEEIKAELEKIKADIDAFLKPAEEPEEKVEEVHEEVESDEDKEHRVFGI
jgi:orotate phosphoribosyltransferase-like protein